MRLKNRYHLDNEELSRWLEHSINIYDMKDRWNCEACLMWWGYVSLNNSKVEVFLIPGILICSY